VSGRFLHLAPNSIHRSEIEFLTAGQGDAALLA
jgi:hypothetical protein